MFSPTLAPPRLRPPPETTPVQQELFPHVLGVALLDEQPDPTVDPRGGLTYGELQALLLRQFCLWPEVCETEFSDVCA